MCAISCTFSPAGVSWQQYREVHPAAGHPAVPENERPMQPIVTQTDKCRKCYSCVRSCPVKAIKVDRNFTEIIFDRCIGCGNCLSNCPQKAKQVNDKVAVTERLLASDQPVIAVLGCSFPAFFHTATPGQLVAGLKHLGFAEVHE